MLPDESGAAAPGSGQVDDHHHARGAGQVDDHHHARGAGQVDDRHHARGAGPDDDERTPGEAEADARTLREAERRGWQVTERAPPAPHRYAIERGGRRILCGDLAALRQAIGATPTGGPRR